MKKRIFCVLIITIVCMLQSTQASYVAANELKNNIQEVKKNDNYSEEKSYTAYYSDITDWYVATTSVSISVRIHIIVI